MRGIRGVGAGLCLLAVGVALGVLGTASTASAQGAEYAGTFVGGIYGDYTGTLTLVIDESGGITGTADLAGFGAVPVAGSLDGGPYVSGTLPNEDSIFFGSNSFIGTDGYTGTWNTGSQSASGTFDGQRGGLGLPDATQAQAQTAINAAGSQRKNFNRRMENLRSGGGGGVDLAGLSLDLYGAKLSPGMLTSGESGLAQLVRALGTAFDSTSALGAVRGRHDFAGESRGFGRPQAWNALPRSPQTPSFADTAAAADPAAGEAGGGALISDFGAFLNGTVALSDQDATATLGGFDATTFGLSSGVDKRYGDSIVAGVGLGYTRDGTDFDGGGESTSNAVYGVLYGTATPWREAFVDGVLSLGWLGFDTDRVASPGVVARGETNAAQLWGGLTGGWAFPIDATTLSPYARLNGGSTWVADYAETGAGGANLAYDDNTIWSLSTVLGLRIDHAISTDLGVLVPYVRGEYEHEFGDAATNDVRPVNGSFGTGPISGGALDRDFFNVGGGLSMVLPHAWSGFVDYDGLFGADDLTRHTITAGIRREF